MTIHAIRGHISSHWLQLLFHYLAEQGQDADSLLGMACPEPAELRRVSAEQWRQMLDTAASALNDPALGLHLGSRMSLKQLGLLGYAASAANTLGEALLQLQQFQQLVYQIDPVQLQVQDGLATLQWHTTVGDPGQRVDETAIAALLSCTRELLGPAAPKGPLRMSFVNPPCASEQAYIDTFACLPQFQAATISIALPAHLLQAGLAKPDPALLDILDQQAALLLEQIPGTDPFEHELRRALTAAIAGGDPSLQRVAASLHCAPRTLQRKLSQRGLNFQKILDDSRQQLAQRYLQDRSIPLSEVALLLGYSEQSAFTRAFKRWSGQSPRQRREALFHQTS